MKFSLKTLLVLVLFASVCLGWWLDRSALSEQVRELEELETWGGYLDLLEKYEQCMAGEIGPNADSTTTQ